MAEFDNRVLRTTADATAAGVDAGLRSFMLRVYNYMLIGLVITGVAAMATYSVSFEQSAAGLIPTPIGQALFLSPLRWVVLLAPLGLVLFLQFRIHKMSVAAAQLSFWAYAALLGVMLSTIFVVYTGASITQVFFVT